MKKYCIVMIDEGSGKWLGLWYDYRTERKARRAMRRIEEIKINEGTAYPHLMLSQDFLAL